MVRVSGVDDSRVVDAIAFPLLPPGHPQAAVYALANKVATDILSKGYVGCIFLLHRLIYGVLPSIIDKGM
jgi:choline dehydrogenase-like flavoprotein